MRAGRARAGLAAALAALAGAAAAQDEPASAQQEPTAAAQEPPAARQEPAAARAEASEAEPPPAEELVRRGEAVLRGAGTFVEVELQVSSLGRNQPRTVRFRAWWDGRGERALVRVLAPEKRAGLAFLSLPPNLWRWSPRDRETTRIPVGVRRAAWLGSDLSVDDATSVESAVHGATHRVLRVDALEGGRRAWVVESLAREPASARSARVLRWLEVERGVPLREERYGADGALLQTVERGEPQETAGRWFPRLWIVRSREGDGRETRLRFTEVRDAPALPDALFTTAALPPKA